MADEKVITPSEDSPVASAAADGHKRKLDEMELKTAAEQVTATETNSDRDSLSNGSQEEGNGAVDESETKRPRLESNGDNPGEADDLAPQNGHQEEVKEDEPIEEEVKEDEPIEEEVKEDEPIEEEVKEDEPIEEEVKEDKPKEEEVKEDEPKEEEVKENEPKEEEPEGPESEDNNGQPVEGQEPAEEPLQTITEETAPNEKEIDDNEKTNVGGADELGEPNAKDDDHSEIPREGDVPVHSADKQGGSDTQILSRKMEVPNDKVGVLIGKGGDTIRSLQDHSGAKIQIERDADADLRSTARSCELVGTLQSINKAEKLIKDVIAEADAGGSPSLVARGFNTVQAASGGEELEIQVPHGKVGLIIGKSGETIRNLQTRSGARIQLLQNPPDGEQSKDRTVRVTGNKKQIETAREMIKDAMNQTVRPSPLSSGYSQQGYRPRGPVASQWGGPRGPHHAQYSAYDYQQRGPYPSQSSQYPHQSYGNYPPPQAPRSNFGPSWEQRPPAPMHGPTSQGNYGFGQQPGPDYGHPPAYSQAPPQSYGHTHGYNEAKYDHHAPSQHYGHMGSQPTPYGQGGPHSGYGPQDQYSKPPMYGIQAQVPPHSQPYGQPRPNQPGEVPYQGPGSAPQSYPQNMPPQQQSYPYASSAPVQQSYPPYAGATDNYGHTPTASASAYPTQGGQPVTGYGQPAAQQVPSYPQAGPTGGYASYPTAQPGYAEQPPAASTAPYGYQAPADPAYGATQAAAAYAATGAVQSSYAQPSQTQPTYDQSGGYGNVAPAAGYGKAASPQPAAYPQYDSSQMYGAHR